VGSPSKIHTVTRAYLAGWAPVPAGVLRPWHVEHGPQKPKDPAAVGWIHEWWGEGERELNAACEQACGQLESLTARLLANIDAQWLPPTGVRALLAQFVALHIVRSEASKSWFTQAQAGSLARIEAKWDSKKVRFEEFATRAKSERERATSLLGMINKLATLVGSMHWTLIRFQEPLLLTSDQPVVGVPLLDQDAQRDIQAMPAAGWADTVEIRFALSPRLALVATWDPGHEGEKPIDGTWHDAVNLNVGARAQAMTWWFHDPTRLPPLPAAIFREPQTKFPPLSQRLIPGYNSIQARQSSLRQAVVHEVNKLIDTRNDSLMCIARPSADENQAA
jgi:hypothetical protein